MKIEHITTTAVAGEPCEGERKLIIVVDNETEITVFGYGSGEYELRVHNVNPFNATYDPAAILEAEEVTWGNALVWAEPLTIAHLVMDVINYQ